LATIATAPIKFVTGSLTASIVKSSQKVTVPFRASAMSRIFGLGKWKRPVQFEIVDEDTRQPVSKVHEAVWLGMIVYARFRPEANSCRSVKFLLKIVSVAAPKRSESCAVRSCVAMLPKEWPTPLTLGNFVPLNTPLWS